LLKPYFLEKIKPSPRPGNPEELRKEEFIKMFEIFDNGLFL